VTSAKRWLGWSGKPRGRSASTIRRRPTSCSTVGSTSRALTSVYVSDAYVSGRLEADLDGTVTEVFEAS